MTLITAGWLAALRARARDSRFAEARQALAEQVAPYRGALPPHPERQAGYYHDFFCPEHAVQLRFDPGQPHRHVCPVDDAVFAGEPFDSAWRWSLNDLLSDAALKLALSATLDGDEPCSDRECALGILLGYTQRYRTMPPPPVPHPHHPGVVTWSGLDESVWIIRLAWSHAVLGAISSGATWDEHDAAIRNDLLRPAAERLRRVRWPKIHNVRVWNNAALVTLALALDDDELLDETLHGPLGVDAQLAEGLLADGSWWEGSLSYHYYTLAAVVWTVRALRAAGRSFAGDDAVRRMFAAPLALAFPDLTLPAIHDCWAQIGLVGEVGHGIPHAAGFYEVAYGWYGDPAFAWVLRQNGSRRSLEALLDGAMTIPTVQEPAIDRQVAAVAGLAVLRTRAPRDRQTHLLLKAGPSGEDHGHPDQLSIQLFAHGARLVSDPGTAGYGIGLNDTWYRQTASHATVLLDGQSQPIASAHIERYEPDGDVAVAEASVRWHEGLYVGVQMRRTLILRDHYCLDVVQVRCPGPRQIDWLLPCLGSLVTVAATRSAGEELIGTCGYEHFEAVARLTESGSARLQWQIGSACLTLYLPLDEEERFVATSPGNPAAETVSVLVRRRIAASTLFVAVLAPSAVDAPANVRGAHWETAQPRAIKVDTVNGIDQWVIDAEGAGVSYSFSDCTMSVM